MEKNIEVIFIADVKLLEIVHQSVSTGNVVSKELREQALRTLQDVERDLTAFVANTEVLKILSDTLREWIIKIHSYII